MPVKASLLASVGLLAVVVNASGAQVDPAVAARSAPIAPRILYSSDWSGTGQIYAVDPSRRGATGQLTFGRAPACLTGNPCGFAAASPSPDGRRVLLWDYVALGGRTLFVSRADGRARLRLGSLGSYREAVWAPDSRRIAFTGTGGIHVVNAGGSGDRLVSGTRDRDHAPAWSPDGRSLAFISQYSDSTTNLVLVRGSGRRVLVTSASGFAWSPSGKWIAYTTGPRPGLELVTPDASRRRRLAGENVSRFSWSPSGRLLAFVSDGLHVADVSTRTVRAVSSESPSSLAWSPDSRMLAITSKRGIELVDVTTRRSRVLSSDNAGEIWAWSPDGRLLAYFVQEGTSWNTVTDLRVVDRQGNARTVVSSGGEYGGVFAGFAWTRPPTGTRYKRPAPRKLAGVSPDALIAPSPIQTLAADGGHVVYVASGHVFAWTPASGKLEQAEAQASLSPRCSSGPSYYDSRCVYSLAVAGDRVAFGIICCGMTRIWWLGGRTLGLTRSGFTLGEGSASNVGPRTNFVGDLAGSGSLLVFSSQDQKFRDPCCGSGIVTTEQRILRVGPAGCPCPTIASTPGALTPFDVDGGRIVAGGENETRLFDADGKLLLSIRASARAAALSGSDLVAHAGDELRRYDTGTGVLLRTWPVSGGFQLQDVARGLVAYVLDGQVHLLRLADGADATIGQGTLARFMDAGLVYADGARLHLRPFDRLPLR